MKKNFNARNNNYGKIFCIHNDEECHKKIVECYMASVEPAKGHIATIPAKTKINISASFILYLCPNEEIDEEWEELPDEEWEELLDDNIDGITYRSSKSSLSYVNKNEKIKSKLNGSAAIKQPLLLKMILKALIKQEYMYKLKARESIGTESRMLKHKILRSYSILLHWVTLYRNAIFTDGIYLNSQWENIIVKSSSRKNRLGDYL